MKIDFNPGPSQLYFTVEDHARKAFREGIPSISHRSKTFSAVYQSCAEGLKTLLGIPDNFGIYFTGSATEVWERIIQNLVEKKSTHLVSGDFAQKFYEIALAYGKEAKQICKPAGQGFDLQDLNLIEDTELLGITHNETSTGVSFDLGHIKYLRQQHPDALIAVDAVSSLPQPAFDFNDLDCLYFSVQKGFGLPAGLGVWIANDRCLDKAHQLKAKGVNIGSYHSLPSLHKHYQHFQTPATPNVLSIYLLDKVIQDMLRRGIKIIRSETEYKAALIYGLLDRAKQLKAAVSNASQRSKTVIVLQSNAHTQALKQYLKELKLEAGNGYGTLKDSQLRFANFPAHSKEQFEALADALEAFDSK
ncbi:MAG TPA: aminotransferase class V-fold PLP-dependent enzyme [Cyclobacteriaceae bacterium]|nr:aminotransferase class V-fold PLP-dependent enzyme [Cyclobacteriaceae bacterium]